MDWRADRRLSLINLPKKEMRTAQLGPADAAAFQELRLCGLAECPTAFASSYDDECSTPLAAVAERLAPRGDRAVLGAFVEEALVGVVGVRREQARKLSHKAYIWGMYVASRARKAGVGRALVSHALSYAQSELQVRRVNLGVNALNVAALSLYESLGFKRIGFEPCFMLVDREPHDEIHMVCVLESEKREGT